jgi:hypothetical protein
MSTPKIAAERLRNLLDLVSLHLQLFARTIVELIRKEAMSAAHVTNRRHQNVKQNWREGLANRQLRVTF